MINISRFFSIIILIVLSIGLCGCPPLDHKIFIRNIGLDTAQLIFLYKAPFDTMATRDIPVRSKNQIISINKKNISLLDQTLMASVDTDNIKVIVPPKTTLFLSDVIHSFYMFADKSLIIEKGGKSDTMIANYPYRSLKGFKRKFDRTYNYFYKTVMYYDIK